MPDHDHWNWNLRRIGSASSVYKATGSIGNSTYLYEYIHMGAEGAYESLDIYDLPMNMNMIGAYPSSLGTFLRSLPPSPPSP